jgi:glycosyltransferase involved in cell wall biosynthesis
MASRLPPPPAPEELRASTPAVAPLADDPARPFWSVMIPTHNCATYLRETLASVLAQDPGPAAMQIEVIDDCSTADDPAAVVAELGRGRVAFHRNSENLGPTQTFNVCIARARGRWVHILHGDDLVLPGFYDECASAIAAVPDLVMVMGPVVTIDEHGRWLSIIGPRGAHVGGVFHEFLREQALEQNAQYAGTVVKREAYERVGGFCTVFGHAQDLDMWFRVGLEGLVWCTRRPYGVFRIHSASDTRRQMVLGTNVGEEVMATQINLGRLASRSIAPPRAWRKRLSRRAHRTARKLHRAGSTEGRLNQARWAVRLYPGRKNLWLWLRAWLGHRLARPER